METEQCATAPQLYQRASELKETLGSRPPKSVGSNVVFDGETWTELQELQLVLRKLLLSDLDYALDKKAEVDLWNYCFKDHVNHLQAVARDKLRRRQASEAQVALAWFLETASGFYLMLLREMRERFRLDLPCLRSATFFGMIETTQSSSFSKSPQLSNCLYFMQHCLVHLGDLARYRNHARRAESFYRQAVEVAPGSGQAYNQLALLHANRGDHLGAVFFYVRSLALKYPFPAAATNLAKLFSRLQEQEGEVKKEGEKSSAANSKLTVEEFCAGALHFNALTHHARRLNHAARLCRRLEASLNALVAAEAFGGPWTLIQLVAISLFQVHKAASDGDGSGVGEALCGDERRVVALGCEFVAALLNAFLLPVYTIKQGESLLDYSALPAVKLLLDWLVLNPWTLNQTGFTKRLQIWPSLCRVLNELSQLLLSTEKEANLNRFEDYPLPEDYDLQAFLPLQQRLKMLNFRRVGQVGEDVPSEKALVLLRAQRLIGLGQTLSGEAFKGKRMMTCKTLEDAGSSQLNFEALEHKVPEELIDELHLDSTSESEQDDKQEEPKEAPVEGKTDDETQERIGVLKVSKGENVSPPSQAPVSNVPKRRTNVAMAAILRNQSHRQVSFKTPPSPALSSSQESSTMSQESGAGQGQGPGVGPSAGPGVGLSAGPGVGPSAGPTTGTGPGTGPGSGGGSYGSGGRMPQEHQQQGHRFESVLLQRLQQQHHSTSASLSHPLNVFSVPPPQPALPPPPQQARASSFFGTSSPRMTTNPWAGPRPPSIASDVVAPGFVRGQNHFYHEVPPNHQQQFANRTNVILPSPLDQQGRVFASRREGPLGLRPHDTHVDRLSTQSSGNGDHLLSLLGGNVPQSSGNRTEQAAPASYSLFSGPSWTGGSQAILGRNHNNSETARLESSSALETLLRGRYNNQK